MEDIEKYTGLSYFQVDSRIRDLIENGIIEKQGVYFSIKEKSIKKIKKPKKKVKKKSIKSKK